MTRIAVLTDLHIEPAPRAPLYIDPCARLRAALAHIGRHAHADRIVLTGDLTHRGDPASYALLRDILAEAPLPVHLLIGNHDDRAAFQGAFPEVPVDANGFVQQVLDLGPDDGGDRLIFLDTLNAPPYDYPVRHIGHLGPDRLDWLSSQLATSRRCVLFLHHPPHRSGFAGMDAIRLNDGAALHDLIARHGTVAHIVAGHVHRAIHGSHRGVPFSVFKSLVGQMPMLFDTTDTSIEAPEPAAYGLIDLAPDGITVHTEDFGLTDLSAWP